MITYIIVFSVYPFTKYMYIVTDNNLKMVSEIATAQ